MQKLTKDAKQLQNKIRAFLKSLGVDPRPKRMKLTVDFLCDFVNTDHNKAIADIESEVFAEKISGKDFEAVTASKEKHEKLIDMIEHERHRVEVMKAHKASNIIIP